MPPSLFRLAKSPVQIGLRCHSDEQPELNLENDYLNKTRQNLKTNSSISIL